MKKFLLNFISFSMDAFISYEHTSFAAINGRRKNSYFFNFSNPRCVVFQAHIKTHFLRYWYLNKKWILVNKAGNVFKIGAILILPRSIIWQAIKKDFVRLIFRVRRKPSLVWCWMVQRTFRILIFLMIQASFKIISFRYKIHNS